MNIFVGNLNFKVSEEDLQRAFEEHGAVDSVKIISDKYSGRSKGFGFVTMENQEEAQKAIDEMNGMEFEGREMVVNEAKPRRTDY